MTSNLTALVTGGTGFIGSYLLKRLSSEGWNVHLLTRPGSDLSRLTDIRDCISIHPHDGTTESLVALMREARPDVVFHLASLFLPQHEVADVVPLIECNITFGAQVAEAMVRNGISRLINTGTSWQHYEDDDYNPVCLYAATKQAFEDLLAYFVETKALRIVTLKLFDTYGPGDPRPKLFTLLRRVAETKLPLAMSPGEQMLDLVYIDDVIDAFLMTAQHLCDGKVERHERYAITSGKPIRLKDLVELYGRIIRKPIPIKWGERPYRPREVMLPWTRGKTLPGWQPKVTLDEGIRKTLSLG